MNHFKASVLMLFCAIAAISVGNSETIYQHYGVIVDAGSSSTKVRVYAWDNVQWTVPHFNEIFYQKVKPGISTFEGREQEVGPYVQNILTIARVHVPENYLHETPIFFMATAGLRLLPAQVSQSINLAVENALLDTNSNPFRFEREYAHVLSGEEEALYAWLTVNYLLGGFDYFQDGQHELAGIIEVGGGSAQIAFVPATPIYEGRIPAPINGHEIGVYGHSHLSYGATVITERVEEYLFLENPHADGIVNPCMLKGDSMNATLSGRTVEFVGGGDATLCESILQSFLTRAEDDHCSPKPCSIGEVYQPSLEGIPFVTFGLVYYLSRDLGVWTEPGLLDLNQMRQATVQYCEQTYEHVVGTIGISEMYASRNCQDGLYVPLLFDALKVTGDGNLVYALNDINGSSIAWSLGAMMYQEERTNNHQQDFDYGQYGQSSNY